MMGPNLLSKIQYMRPHQAFRAGLNVSARDQAMVQARVARLPELARPWVANARAANWDLVREMKS